MKMALLLSAIFWRASSHWEQEYTCYLSRKPRTLFCHIFVVVVYTLCVEKNLAKNLRICKQPDFIVFTPDLNMNIEQMRGPSNGQWHQGGPIPNTANIFFWVSFSLPIWSNRPGIIKIVFIGSERSLTLIVRVVSGTDIVSVLHQSYREIHPRCPRPERFPEGAARGTSRGQKGWVSQ